MRARDQTRLRRALRIVAGDLAKVNGDVAGVKGDVVELKGEVEKRPVPPPETYHRGAMLKRLRDTIKDIAPGPTRTALEQLYFLEAQR